MNGSFKSLVVFLVKYRCLRMNYTHSEGRTTSDKLFRIVFNENGTFSLLKVSLLDKSIRGIPIQNKFASVFIRLLPPISLNKFYSAYSKIYFANDGNKIILQKGTEIILKFFFDESNFLIMKEIESNYSKIFNSTFVEAYQPNILLYRYYRSSEMDALSCIYFLDYYVGSITPKLASIAVPEDHNSFKIKQLEVIEKNYKFFISELDLNISRNISIIKNSEYILSHGDLHKDNVIVSNEQFFVIDLDDVDFHIFFFDLFYFLTINDRFVDMLNNESSYFELIENIIKRLFAIFNFNYSRDDLILYFETVAVIRIARSIHRNGHNKTKKEARWHSLNLRKLNSLISERD